VPRKAETPITHRLLAGLTTRQPVPSVGKVLCKEPAVNPMRSPLDGCNQHVTSPLRPLGGKAAESSKRWC